MWVAIIVGVVLALAWAYRRVAAPQNDHNQTDYTNTVYSDTTVRRL
jgi:MFS superfamily sulfate permease-like transporter